MLLRIPHERKKKKHGILGDVTEAIGPDEIEELKKKEEAIIRMTPIRYWDCGADTQTERKETKAALTRSGRYKYKNVDEESRGKERERTRSGDDILKWIRDKRARTDGLDAA